MSDHDNDCDKCGHSHDGPGMDEAIAMLDTIESVLTECADTIDAWNESCGLTTEQISDMGYDDFPPDVATAVLLGHRCGLAGHWVMAAIAEQVWDALPFAEGYLNFVLAEVEPAVEITALEKMWGASDD